MFTIRFDRADVNLANRRSMWTPIISAAFQGHGKVIMKLMEFNPDLTLKDNHGRLVIFIVIFIFFICVLVAIVCTQPCY